MYGKFFSSTFTGSMFGSGLHVFAVWGYVIANAVDGIVEVNPALVAAILGASESEVELALTTLTSPDPKSRSEAEDGRRMIHEGGYAYRVVNHAAYRAIRNEEERRAYNREAQRKSRQSKSNSPSMTVIDNNRLSIVSAHTEAEAEAKTETEAERAGEQERATAQPPPAFSPPKHQPQNGLINGAEMRRHGQHAWCDPIRALCVPAALHEQFQKNGLKSDAELKAWYQATVASVEGKPVGGLFEFWRVSFENWVGMPIKKAATGYLTKGDRVKQAVESMKARGRHANQQN